MVSAVPVFLFAVLQTVQCLNLTILHNNDFHSRFAPTTNDSSPCDTTKSTCIAGAARTTHFVEEFKKKEENVIFLSAGDFFQGSLWYTEFKEPLISAIVPHMGYDAVCLGNHEFDDGSQGLYRYVDNMTSAGIPVVAVNLDLSKVPVLHNVKRSTILTRDGNQIGIIGYLTPDTTFLSSPDKEIVFNDEIEEIRKEAAILKEKGVKILIALGHSGYAKDKEIAESIEDLDIVVGGHTNTFLWNEEFGPPPSREVPLGEYPTVINHGERKTLVVQAFAYGKYVGRLNVVFDDDGNVQSYEGRPILMDEHVPEDTSHGIKDKLVPYEKKIKDKFSDVVGRSAVFLDGGEHTCRLRECNMGNMVADALVYGFLANGQKNFTGWSRYAIAINPGGTVRTSFNPTHSHGVMTLGDVIAVLPFENELVTLNISGETLKSVMEHGVSAYDPTEQRLEGRFPQVSGIRVTYDMSQKVGSRVTSLRVRCSECQSPVFEDVVPDRYYIIITTDFMSQGGDGYDMLKACAGKCREEFGLRPVDLVRDFLNQTGIVTTGAEDRILITSAGHLTAVTSIILILVSSLLPGFCH